jgi:hypothetical protein
VSRLTVAALAAALAGCANTPHVAAQVQPNSPGSRPGLAANPPATAAPAPAETEALAKALRGLLLQHLPDPLVQTAPGWGHQKEVTVGGRLRGAPVKAMRNDGHWRRLTVRAKNPAHTLALGVKDAAYPEPGRVTFTALLGLDCGLKFEQQLWRHGARLYSGETRARCRAALALKCEVTSRTEPKPGSLLPDVVFRVRVTDAQFFYDGLVVEHTAGVGGDAARLLGDAVIQAVKKVKPDLERDLLARANAAIVKAADTKEVRVSLGKLLEGKFPDVTRSK